jgi:hypothetical protein
LFFRNFSTAWGSMVSTRFIAPKRASRGWSLALRLRFPDLAQRG